MNEKEINRIKRHRRIRRKVIGTAERPRLSVFRSGKHLYAQLVDDIAGKTLLSFSTLDKSFKEKKVCGGNKKGAEAMAQLLADKLKSKTLSQVTFDRGGYKYHGRVQVFAEALRKQGVKF